MAINKSSPWNDLQEKKNPTQTVRNSPWNNAVQTGNQEVTVQKRKLPEAPVKQGVDLTSLPGAAIGTGIAQTLSGASNLVKSVPVVAEAGARAISNLAKAPVSPMTSKLNAKEVEPNDDNVVQKLANALFKQEQEKTTVELPQTEQEITKNQFQNIANREMIAQGQTPVKQITDWTNPWDKALAQNVENVQNAGRTYSRVVTPATDWLDNASQKVTDYTEREFMANLNPTEQFVAQAAGNAIPNFARNALLATVSGGSSAVLGLLSDAFMFAPSFYQGYEEGLAKGLSEEEAMLNATLRGVTEAGTEHLSDVWKVNGGQSKMDEWMLEKIAKSNLNPWAKFMGKGLASGIGESMEEVASRIGNTFADRAFYGNKIDAGQLALGSLEDAGASFISTMVMGLLGGEFSGTSRRQWNAYVDQMQNESAADVLNEAKDHKVELALTYASMSPNEAYDFVSKAQDIIRQKYGNDNEIANMDTWELVGKLDQEAVQIYDNLDDQLRQKYIDRMTNKELPLTQTTLPDGSTYNVYEYLGTRTTDQERALDMARRMGKDILFADELPMGQNALTLGDGTIIISSKAKRPATALAFHEIFHALKSDGQWNDLMDLAYNYMANEKGFSNFVEDLVSRYVSYYGNLDNNYLNSITASKELTDEQKRQEVKDYLREQGVNQYYADPNFHNMIDEEIAADFMERLNNEDSIKAMYNRSGDLFDRTWQNLKDAVQNFTGVLTKDEQNLRKTEQLFAKVAQDQSQNQLSRNIAYSLKSMGIDLELKTDSEMIQEMISTGVFQDDENSTALQKAQEFVKNIDRLMKLLEQKAFLDMHEEADRDTRAFSPYKKNSDKLYEISLDYSTLCKKRIITQAIIENLALEQGRAIDAKTQFAITELLRHYQEQESKLQVACALCYVEAARLKSPKVINQFIDHPEKYLTSYFVQKSGSDGKAIIANAQAEFKQLLGLDPKVTKKVMAEQTAEKMTVGQFNEILRQLGAEETTGNPDEKVSTQKVKNAYNSYIANLRQNLTDSLTDEEKATIELAKSLDPKYYLTAQGLTDLKQGKINGQYNPLAKDIYNAFTKRVSSATRSKAIETDVAYYWGDAKQVPDSLIKKMNAENGLRTQSWSDFQMHHLLDEISSTAELATRGAKVHAYTKVPEYVLVNGRTGKMINNSLIPAGQTGFDQYGNLVFSPTEGMPIEDSNRLRRLFPDTDGSISIGINDDHIRALLRDERIDYVIPYHVSGLTAHLRTIAGINKWANYTGTQNEVAFRDNPGEAIKFSDWFTDDIKNQNKSGLEIMKDAQQKYLDLCAERGYIPKFPQFLINNGDGSYSISPDAENYWKLLIDRKMVNQITGDIIEQKPVRPDYNWEDTEVDGVRVPGLFSLVEEAEDPRTSEIVERMTGVVKKAIEDGTVGAIERNSPDVQQVMDYFLEANPIEKLGEDEDDDLDAEWNGDPYDPETAVSEQAAAAYSLNDDELDRLYFDALEREGNESPEARRLLEERANERGYTDRAYHGTPEFGFTVPDTQQSDDKLSFFATDDPTTAQTYSGFNNVRPISGSSDIDYIEQEAELDAIAYDRAIDFATAINRLAGVQGYVSSIDQMYDRLYEIAEDAWERTQDISLVEESINEDLDQWVWDAYRNSHDDEDDIDDWYMSHESDDVSHATTNLANAILNRVGLEGEAGTGIYDLRINGDNLLRFDARGNDWNNINIPSSVLPEGINLDDYRNRNGNLTTRGLAQLAKDAGYEGFEVNNLFDDGGRGADRAWASTVFDFFNPQSQVKSNDLITYDDNGNIIPPSQRYNANNPDIRYSLDNFDVTEPHLELDDETLNWLNNQPTQTVYRAMQVIDGELYPPMAAKVKDANGKNQLVQPSRIGEWERSIERPDLITDGNKFNLNKGNGSSPVAARYNPYFHTSMSPLNDQFSSAYNRPNLVVVEGEVPMSELEGVYKAQYAKDPVGMMKWHSGPVSSKLKGDKARRVILSRWFKPVRVVSDSEVADHVANLLEGENIEVPYNTVTPGLRAELEKRGVPISGVPNETQGVKFSLNEQAEQEAIDNYIPEQANAFADRNIPQNRSAMNFLGQMSRERNGADPLTYESISPESFPVPDRIQDYIDLINDEEDRKYGFDAPIENELTDEDKDFYQGLVANKTGALQGFATPTQTFNAIAKGEQREELRDRFERPMYETKKEYNANREQRWNALENMIKETGIQANTPESAAVQWYGEGVKPNEQGETIPYTLDDLKREFPNKWQDIQKMERFMRQMYDEYVGRINAALEQVYPNLEEKAQAQLQSWRNKKMLYQDEISMSRNPSANEYWQNEINKLDAKIAKLEGDLESGEYFRNKRLNPRKDYFHHFQEVETSGLGGLKNILQASTLIDPELVGKSEFTKPKSKWMAWLQKRGEGAYTADAVLGMGKYIDSAEYAIAFDPLIAQYRDEISKMVKATRETKNANQLIQYLSAYTNQLAGKTASLDRTILDLLGEGNRGQLFNVLAAINNRAKSNAVVGNVRSAVAQIFNIPNALGIIKSNNAWLKGANDYINAKLGNRELLDQSPFLQERYFSHNVDDLKARNTNWEKIIGKAGDITNKMMEFGDREATELIWLAAYNEGLEKNVSDPVYYADDLTRRSVAGRGIGEVPYNMKSKVASFFMPFQVETNNAWQELKQNLRDKDANGIFRLMLGSYILNGFAKLLFNDGVVPDVLGALIDGIGKLFDKDREESVGEVALNTGKRIAGEAVSYIPGTSLWLPAIMSDESAEALFGDSDPTRYGTGTVGLSTITKTLADAVDGGDFDIVTPLLQMGLPYGGRQASRLYNTLQDFNVLPSNGVMNTPIGGEKNPVAGDYTQAGALKYRLPEEVNSAADVAEIARALAFGSNSTNAASEYYDTLKPVLSKERVAKLREHPEVNPDTYIDYLNEASTDGKQGITQQEAYDWISSHNLSDEEANALWEMTSSSWKKSYDEYQPKEETPTETPKEEKTENKTEKKSGNPTNKKEFTAIADSDGNGSLKQAEAYAWLNDQKLSDAEKEALWALMGWKTDYETYASKH